MNSSIAKDFEMNIQDIKPRLWTANYINTLVVSLIINIAGNILITVLPLFTISIGGNNFMAGTLTTLLTMSALFCRPIFGKMLDNKGRKIVLILGLCLFATSTIVLIAATNVPLLLTLRFLQGIGLSAYSTALGTILSDVVPASRLSEGVGYFGIAGTIAMAVGPSLGLYLSKEFGYQSTYGIACGICVVSVFFASLINYEKKEKNIVSEVKDIQESKDKRGFIEKSSLRPCIVLIFTVLAISSVFSFMPLFSQTRNIDNIGLFFTFYAISMIFARLFTGKAADRFGYLKVFIPSIIITFMLFITLAFAYSLPPVLIAAVFYGVGFGTLQPLMNTIVIRLSPTERLGAANATYYATLDIGFGMGSFMWGAVSQISGFTAVFISCAVCAILSGIAYYFLLHKFLRENLSQSH